MNIQEAVIQSLETKKMITRGEMKEYLAFIPTDDPCKGIMLVDLKKERLPGKHWQPFAEDLIANDWCVIDKDLPTECS